MYKYKLQHQSIYQTFKKIQHYKIARTTFWVDTKTYKYQYLIPY